MKHVLLSLALFASVAVFADEIESSNVIGVLPVTSSAKRTIVSVPWCAMSATDNAAIQVSNIVKTANLTAGDMLYYVQSNGEYTAWRLSDTEVKYWESVNIASDKSVTVSEDAHDQTIARGNSIILVRQNPGTAESPNTFYIYGQVGTSDATVSTAVVQGSSVSPAYTLIAAPSAAAWNLNDITWTGAGENDQISVPLANGYVKTLTFSGGKWGSNEPALDSETHMTKYTWTQYSTAIPAGQGVWYVSFGGNPTISWSSVPVK